MANLKYRPLEPTWVDYHLFGRKPCPSCGRILPKCADWFAYDDTSSDGLTAHCRDCRNEADKARRGWGQ